MSLKTGEFSGYKVFVNEAMSDVCPYELCCDVFVPRNLKLESLHLLSIYIQ